MHHLRRRVSSEGVGKQVEHLGALGEVGINVRLDERKAVIAIVTANESQVVADRVGADFGGKSVDQIEWSIEQANKRQREPPE